MQGHISQTEQRQGERDNHAGCMRIPHAHACTWTSSRACQASRSRVLVDSIPSRASGHRDSVGVLEAPRGTPIIRHTEAFAMRCNLQTTVQHLSNNELSFADGTTREPLCTLLGPDRQFRALRKPLPLILQEAPTSLFSRHGARRLALCRDRSPRPIAAGAAVRSGLSLVAHRWRCCTGSRAKADHGRLREERAA